MTDEKYTERIIRLEARLAASERKEEQYRKKLDDLLQNLDYTNMPTIIRKIQSVSGGYMFTVDEPNTCITVKDPSGVSIGTFYYE